MDINKRIRQLEFLREVSLKNNDFKTYVDNFFRDKASHVYNSNKIEGSTVTFSDTLRLLKGTTYLSTDYTKREIDEIKDLSKAVDKLFSFIKNNEKISIGKIKDLHSEIYVYGEFNKGEYRKFSITSISIPIKKYIHIPTISMRKCVI